jgi:hypothetical protein
MTLNEFIEPMRMLLGDNPSIAGTTQYSNEQLQGAVRTVVKMGLAPDGFTIDPVDNLLLSPEPNYDQFGYLSLKSSLILIASAEILSYRTRSLSVTRYPRDKQARISALMGLLFDIQDKGNLGTGVDGSETMFGSSTECLTIFRDALVVS